MLDDTYHLISPDYITMQNNTSHLVRVEILRKDVTHTLNGSRCLLRGHVYFVRMFTIFRSIGDAGVRTCPSERAHSTENRTWLQLASFAGTAE